MTVLKLNAGQKRWSFDAQTGIVAAPITFAVNGKQYITIVVGSSSSIVGNSSTTNAVKGGEMAAVASPPKGRVLTFALGGASKLPAPTVVQLYAPVAPAPSTDNTTVTAREHLSNKTCMFVMYSARSVTAWCPTLRHSTAIGQNIYG